MKKIFFGFFLLFISFISFSRGYEYASCDIDQEITQTSDGLRCLVENGTSANGCEADEAEKGGMCYYYENIIVTCGGEYPEKVGIYQPICCNDRELPRGEKTIIGNQECDSYYRDCFDPRQQQLHDLSWVPPKNCKPISQGTIASNNNISNSTVSSNSISNNNLNNNLNNIPSSIDTYSEILAKYLLRSKPTNMKQVLYNYCNAVLKASAAGVNITGDNYYYSAKDSIFVYMICYNISSDFDEVFNSKFNATDKGYFTKSSFNQLGIVDYSQDVDRDYCDPKNGDLQNCNLMYHLPRVFNMIINDIFSVQQSRIYGTTTPDFDRKTVELQIDDYAMDKFTIKFCDSTDGVYPKLCKDMKKYSKTSAKLLKDLDILNYDNLYEDFGTDLTYFSQCEKSYSTYNYNQLSCGLFGYGFVINSLYINLVYNEFLYYALFVKYYNYIILSNPNLAPSEYKKDPQVAINYLKNNAYQFNREVNSSQRAISLGLKMLREIDVSFPLHVGFMMYQEDLLNLRDKSLYKIVTPFYTLYDKLRNVQTKD